MYKRSITESVLLFFSVILCLEKWEHKFVLNAKKFCTADGTVGQAGLGSREWLSFGIRLTWIWTTYSLTSYVPLRNLYNLLFPHLQNKDNSLLSPLGTDGLFCNPWAGTPRLQLVFFFYSGLSYFVILSLIWCFLIWRRESFVDVLSPLVLDWFAVKFPWLSSAIPVFI